MANCSRRRKGWCFVMNRWSFIFSPESICRCFHWNNDRCQSARVSCTLLLKQKISALNLFDFSLAPSHALIRSMRADLHLFFPSSICNFQHFLHYFPFPFASSSARSFACEILLLLLKPIKQRLLKKTIFTWKEVKKNMIRV